jgi:hypothetical protein
VPGFDPIPDGATIDMAATGTTLSVRADTVPAVVGSVAFTDLAYSHTEENAPYMLCGDDSMGDVHDCGMQPGTHVITATIYSWAHLGGTAGPTSAVRFTLIDSSSGAGYGGYH